MTAEINPQVGDFILAWRKNGRGWDDASNGLHVTVVVKGQADKEDGVVCESVFHPSIQFFSTREYVFYPDPCYAEGDNGIKALQRQRTKRMMR